MRELQWHREGRRWSRLGCLPGVQGHGQADQERANSELPRRDVQAVTLPDLQLWVWRELPIRKVLVGRRVVDDLVQLTVETWPAEYMNHATNDTEREVVAKEVVRSVRRLHHACTAVDDTTYGVLWTFVLQALASLVVRLILEWWLERRSNRALLVTWQQELTR